MPDDRKPFSTLAEVQQDLMRARKEQGIYYPPPRKIENAPNRNIHDASYTFLSECGLDATKDAVAQLAEVFLPCLKIMCERGYDPEGKTWIDKGWRGLVHDILNKAGRLRFHSWLHNRFDRDSAIDMINFCGFYIRLENKGEPWGLLGDPGNE